MNHRYTVVDGFLIGKDKKSKLPFALIFEENGICLLETFLEIDFFKEGDFSKIFSLRGITEKGFEIDIPDITFINYEHTNHKAKFICRTYIKLIERERHLPPKNLNKKEDSIFFVEIEGFKTEFANHTDIKKHRRYGEVDRFSINFDHTSCAFYIQVDGYRDNYFHLVFSQSNTSDNILIDFTRTEGYGLLTYKHFRVFRKQFLSFLSFLNGGEVHIRRELTGSFYRVDGLDSQIVYNYSFAKKEYHNTSDYIPINEHHS